MCARAGAQGAADLQAVHVRQAQVEQHDLGFGLAGREGAGAGGRETRDRRSEAGDDRRVNGTADANDDDGGSSGDSDDD